jgi:DNA-binding LacI/PurR family transcriptional regulator
MSLTISPDSIFSRRKPRSADQLAEDLRKAVTTGTLNDGDQLPTIRQLSEETGLAYNAVNRAFSILQAEGLVVSRKRAGTFVTKPKNHTAGDERPVIRVFALIGPELSSGFYPALQKGFDLGSDDLGYQIITSNTNNDVRVQANTILQLMDKSVAGVAIVPATIGPSPAHHIRQLQRNGIPVVMLHRGVDDVQAPLVTIPAVQVGELAGREMIKRGHTRIGFCASQRAGSSGNYLKGLQSAMNDAGLEISENHVHYGDIRVFDNENYADYEASLDKWFDRHMTGPDRPTALFTSFESVGEFAYFVALRRGLRVPEDLSIVTVGGQDRRGAIVRRLACVTVNEQQAGRLTARLLDEMQSRQRPLDDQQNYMIDIDFDPAQSLTSLT